jgi:alkylated DNA repair dioxygenase AlkB
VQQLSLLAPAVPPVPGLAYRPEYITRDEERELIASIDQEPWRTEWQRRRQVYGIAYGSAVKEATAFPPWLQRLADRVARDGWFDADAIANAVINEYVPGQGIGAHRDYAAFGPTVVAVSLGSACILELHPPPDGGEGTTKHLLDVQPRSLWVLGGEARAEWRHGIAARHADVIHGVKRPRARRISVTFRTAAR